LNKALPAKKIVFRDGAGGDAFWWVVGESAILLE
jgi:hypothetical protein